MTQLSEMENAIYKKSIEAILRALDSPDCKAADIQAARQFMKDFGIEGGEDTVQLENTLCDVIDLPQFNEEGSLGEEATG
jgi:hypothetical protein